MAFSTLNAINYQPLDPSCSQIRVIRLSPPTEGIDSPIVINMHTVSLDDPGLRYYALSYVWGDASNTVTITVDGASFQATANLEAALRVFRTTFGADPSMTLWVDAVCIDQENMLERIAQVKLMGRIYRQTSKVLVWLGPGDDHVRAMFAFLRVWSKTLQLWLVRTGSLEPGPWLSAELDKVMNMALDIHKLQFASSEEDDCSYDNIRAVPMKPFPDHEGNGMHPIETLIELFVDRPYWSRTWTFQELQLPKDGVFICGHDAVVGVSEVRSVFMWLKNFGLQMLQHGRPDQVSTSVWGVLRGMVAVLSNLPFVKQLAVEAEIQKGFTNQASSNQCATVNVLLRATQFRQATNHRDLYYGILGVTQLPGLTIDYASSVEEVLTEASEVLCNGGGEMLTYLLCYAGTATPHLKNFVSLPSWVTTRGTIESMFLREIFWISSHAGDSDETSSSYTTPTVLDQDQTLLCEGVVVDTIDQETVKSFRLDETPEGENPVADYVDETVSFFFDCPAGHLISDVVAKGTPYVGGGTQFAALMRFWMQDHLSNGSDQLTSVADILVKGNLQENLELLDAIQLFLLTCCLRDRDVTQMVQMKSKESQEEFGRSVRRTHEFLAKGFVDSSPGASLAGDPAGESCPTWDEVLRFISYQRRSQLTDEEVAIFKLNTFNLAYAALFRTADGYIGVARSGIKSGDKLCVLAGAAVPVILRPLAEEGFYELVSYAFAVGMMHGEAWSMVNSGKRGTQAFLIK